MVEGAGIDIVEIGELKRAVDKWEDRFINRVFTHKELDLSHKKRLPCEYLAGRFAAKEAVLKAFGGRGIDLKDIEVLNEEETGRPFVKLHNKADDFKARRKISSIILSISHTKEYALASAILIRD